MTTQYHPRLWQIDDLPALDFDPVMAELLRDQPVARIRLPYGEGDAWVVTRYQDVKFVTSDPRFSRAAVVGRPAPRMTLHQVPLDHTVTSMDPPKHTRVRRTVAKTFSQSNVERLRAHAEQTVHHLVDAMMRLGRPADLVQHVTSPFSMIMIGELLGIPATDWPQIPQWAQTIISVAHDQTALDRVNRLKAEAAAYFHALIAQRRATPKEDLISTLIAAQNQGHLNDEELLGLIVLLALNGWHTVRNSSSNMMYALLTHPELITRLHAEPGLVPRAVEEFLRYIPQKSGVGQARIATEDVEVGGVLIRAGDVIHVSYVAANRDEHIFPDPHRIDIDRKEVPHLAFGDGPHYCPGSNLARMESETLLATLLTRLPDLRLAIPAEQIRWQTNALIRGPINLPITW